MLQLEVVLMPTVQTLMNRQYTKDAKEEEEKKIRKIRINDTVIGGMWPSGQTDDHARRRATTPPCSWEANFGCLNV